MIYALKNGMKIKAIPNEKAICPLCNEELISKCGDIKIWHWSHKSNNDCDAWTEPESEWHLKWKNYFPEKQQEITLEHNGKKHRADIMVKPHNIIELQNSCISSEEILEREKFYDSMVWLLNGETLCKGLVLRPKKEKIYTFRWKHPPKSWWYAKKPIYIDMEGLYYETKGEIFLIKKIYSNIPCGGWGIFIKKDEFLKRGKYQWF